jgi:hypothetical protein
MALFNDKRTPPGVVTDTSTGAQGRLPGAQAHNGTTLDYGRLAAESPTAQRTAGTPFQATATARVQKALAKPNAAPTRPVKARAPKA